MVNLSSKKLATEPIELPENPFISVLRQFGRDELISLFINVVATAFIARLIISHFLLSVSGPIVEKVGFFAAYFKEAWDIFRTTPKEKRKSLSRYLSNAIKQGTSSLVKDVLFHDPTYAALMFFGLRYYQGTPAWMLSALAFFIAVSAVALGEVTLNEIRFIFHIFRFKKVGFKLESYFETRFIIDKKNARQILFDLAKVFSLKVKAKASYHDRYFETNLINYNARMPKLRLRQRTKEDGGWLQTIQIVYTRASEMAKNKPTQFNYYPTRKDKLWLKLDQKMPWVVDDIKNSKLRDVCRKMVIGPEFHDVHFERAVVRDPRTILVSIDRVSSDNHKGFTVVEIKSHIDEKSKTMLIEAMRYLMLSYPVIQTTYSKSFLSTLNS